VLGLRVSEEEEITGIDQTVHAESGYELTGIGAAAAPRSRGAAVAAAASVEVS
jgi:Amt family ammonium transporter